MEQTEPAAPPPKPRVLSGTKQAVLLLAFLLFNMLIPLNCMCPPGAILGRYRIAGLMMIFCRLLGSYLQKEVTVRLILIYEAVYLFFFALSSYLSGWH